MKTAFLFLVSLLPASALAKTTSDATSCEVFVDQVTEVEGPSGVDLTFYLKTTNTDTNGKVTGVGFRNKLSAYSQVGVVDTYNSHDFQNSPATQFANSADYWFITLHMADTDDSGFGQYEGAFYATTDTGNWYWFKNQDGSNFKVTDDYLPIVSQFMHQQGLSLYTQASPEKAINTRDYTELQSLNPRACK